MCRYLAELTWRKKYPIPTGYKHVSNAPFQWVTLKMEAVGPPWDVLSVWHNTMLKRLCNKYGPWWKQQVSHRSYNTFTQSLQTNTKTAPSNKPQMLSFKSLPADILWSYSNLICCSTTFAVESAFLKEQKIN